MHNKQVISIIGLGYVGLPLAVAFAKKYLVIGYDTNPKRLTDLKNGNDNTLEITKENLLEVLVGNTKAKNGLFLTNNEAYLAQANTYIVTVPTPIDAFKKPNFKPLIQASKTVGKALKKNNIVVYESTVYPGVTEEICVPILEEFSNLQCNTDFFVGYSPERINPGDKKHTLANILKVTSGSTPEAAKAIDALYQSVIPAGTYLASSIKVAEAAKVIENTQRDINIAFINELAKIFRLLGIDTHEVLEAAGTKWNFLKFTPGLVGGHCIGVDPYYLAQKAQEVGYTPEIILAGRRMNDSMGAYIAKEVIKLMLNKHIEIASSNILILGITFKENCPDIRNTRVVDMINELQTYPLASIDVYDPWASVTDVKSHYNLNLISSAKNMNKTYDAIILAVAHQEFLQLNLHNLKKKNAVVFDVKSFLPKNQTDARL